MGFFTPKPIEITKAVALRVAMTKDIDMTIGGIGGSSTSIFHVQLATEKGPRSYDVDGEIEVVAALSRDGDTLSLSDQNGALVDLVNETLNSIPGS